jgi:soluble lytic murein transglycosylase
MVRTTLVFALAATLAAPLAGAGPVEVTVRPDGLKLIRNEPGEARARRFATRLVAAPDPELADLLDRYAFERELDPRLVRAVVQVESGYNRLALSNKGAAGLMQLMPETARDLAVDDPWDAEQNVRGGTAYLRRLLDRFGGDLELALAAYNAGPQAVEVHAGVPPYAETRAYVQRIFCLLDDACTSGEREGRPVELRRGADNRLRMVMSGSGG